MLRLNLKALKRKLVSKRDPSPPHCGNQKHSTPKRHTSARRCIRLRSRLIANCWRCRRINQVYSFAFSSSEHFEMICAGMLGSHAAEFGKMPTDGFVPQIKVLLYLRTLPKDPYHTYNACTSYCRYLLQIWSVQRSYQVLELGRCQPCSNTPLQSILCLLPAF